MLKKIRKTICNNYRSNIIITKIKAHWIPHFNNFVCNVSSTIFSRLFIKQAMAIFLLNYCQYHIETCFTRATSNLEGNTILWQNNCELGGVVIRAMKQSIIQVGVFWHLFVVVARFFVNQLLPNLYLLYIPLWCSSKDRKLFW